MTQTDELHLAALKATAYGSLLFDSDDVTRLVVVKADDLTRLIAALEAAQDTIERMRKHGVGAAALEDDT